VAVSVAAIAMKAGKLVAVFAALVAAAILAPSVFAAGPTVTFSTEPSPDQIIPDATLSTVKIAVLDEQGSPIPNVNVGFNLTAPASGLFFSSDFPIVEGTNLMKYELVAADGVLEFEYLWPIRGSYEIVMSASPTDRSSVQFEPITESRTFSLSENPDELTNVIIFVAVLAVFGLVSGLVLGRSFNVRQEAE
jgi:hypothetical protein